MPEKFSVMSLASRILRLHVKGRRDSGVAARVVFQLARGQGASNAVLGWTGVALAGAAAAFAIRMIATRHDPLIRDMQYLAIFAQPNSAAMRRAQSSPPVVLAETRPAPRIDYTPTASFEKSARRASVGVSRAEKAPYEILGATEQAAWLRIGVDILEVRKGQTVPGVGKILSIEPRDGAWRLIVDNNPSAASELPSSTPRRSAGATRSSDKKLIFGDEKH